MRDSENRTHSRMVKISYLVLGILIVLVLGIRVSAQKQNKVKNLAAPAEEAQQSLYKEYRGVRLGMTTTEVRAKLGEPQFKDDEMDVYVFSDTETTQIAYTPAHKVKIISTDYFGGVGAPDYRSVVGSELQDRPDGSKYRMVQYNSEGYWVSYNKSAGGMVTVTIQVFMR